MDNRNGNINKAQLLSCLKQVRDQLHDQARLIHCITHPIVVNDCANAVLALGGRPIMAEHPAEVADISASAAALPSALEILQMQGLSPASGRKSHQKNERC